MDLSVALAVYNEESNLDRCLSSVRNLADEIVIVDGGSTDRTIPIAKSYRARIIPVANQSLFHINKQIALDNCRGDWILQLDADEEVTPELASEITNVIQMTQAKLKLRFIDKSKWRLFERHQALVTQGDKIASKVNEQIVGFYIPRLNHFLGGPIRYAGTYPDGVIRLFKRGRAKFPSESVHEQIVVDGSVSWLVNDLIHYSNPTFSKYWLSAYRYIDLQVERLQKKKIKINVWSVLQYLLVLPMTTFINLYVIHKGCLDGWRGLVFSLFSASHYPITIWRFMITTHKD